MAYVWAQAGDELRKEVFMTEILLGIAALLAVLCVDGSGRLTYGSDGVLPAQTQRAARGYSVRCWSSQTYS